jgi:hypothetical protein
MCSMRKYRDLEITNLEVLTGLHLFLLTTLIMKNWFLGCRLYVYLFV